MSTLLKVKDLKTTFTVGEQTVTAVDKISFEIPKKSFIGLVGESGSGKSVSALSLLNLLPPNGHRESGDITWKGRKINTQSDKDFKTIRGSEIGLIFQNPLSALNPVFTVGYQMIETIMLHQSLNKREARELAIDLLRQVNISDPEKRVDDYPHQFSIGMCQRVMIALTLSMNPDLLIADEPTASLDVTIQAQILELLNGITKKRDMSILMISHDLGVIAQQCDYIFIMYLGKIVEKGTPKEIFGNPLHPYTQALISSIPIPDPTKKQKIKLLEGEVPSPLNLPTGCRFHPRCPYIMDRCQKKEPKLKTHKKSEVACYLYE